MAIRQLVLAPVLFARSLEFEGNYGHEMSDSPSPQLRTVLYCNIMFRELFCMDIFSPPNVDLRMFVPIAQCCCSRSITVNMLQKLLENELLVAQLVRLLNTFVYISRVGNAHDVDGSLMQASMFPSCMCSSALFGANPRLSSDTRQTFSTANVLCLFNRTGRHRYIGKGYRRKSPLDYYLNMPSRQLIKTYAEHVTLVRQNRDLESSNMLCQLLFDPEASGFSPQHNMDIESHLEKSSITET